MSHRPSRRPYSLLDSARWCRSRQRAIGMPTSLSACQSANRCLSEGRSRSRRGFASAARVPMGVPWGPPRGGMGKRWRLRRRACVPPSAPRWGERGRESEEKGSRWEWMVGSDGGTSPVAGISEIQSFRIFHTENFRSLKVYHSPALSSGASPVYCRSAASKANRRSPASRS